MKFQTVGIIKLFFESYVELCHSLANIVDDGPGYCDRVEMFNVQTAEENRPHNDSFAFMQSSHILEFQCFEVFLEIKSNQNHH